MPNRFQIKSACPHDCPDTCAMVTTVEDGRATRVQGNPDHPVTAGTLCAKVNDYVEVIHPDDASRMGVVDGARVRVWNDRGSFHSTAAVSDDTSPGVLVAPMGWWSRDDTDNSGGPQAVTSQLLTTLGRAPTFNDTRVAISPS